MTDKIKKEGLFFDYHLRPFQREIDTNMKRFTVMMLHRRAGKTHFAVKRMIKSALETPYSDARFGYFAPEQVQGMNIIWNYLKKFTQFLNGIKGYKLRISKREVHFPNGAIIKVFGLAEADSLRGLYFDGVVIDEFSDIKPSAWTEALFPCTFDRDGWALIMGTPKGDDYFLDRLKHALDPKNKDWHGVKRTVYETDVFTPEQIKVMQENMPEASFAQEMLCDPYANFSNKFLLELVTRAETSNRVGDVAYNSKYPVYTAWDLGQDTTAIWFAQKYDGDKIHIIDYWSKANCKSQDFFNALLSKEYVYKHHFLPHDSVSTKVNSHNSVYQDFKDMGLTPAPPLKRLKFRESMASAQMAMPNCYFDEVKCQEGLTALRNYEAKIDPKTTQMLDEKKRNGYDHGGDAFRYLIQGMGMVFSPKHEADQFAKNNVYMSYDEFGDDT